MKSKIVSLSKNSEFLSLLNGNKIAMEKRVSSIPHRYNIETEEEGSLNLTTLGVVGFMAGVGLGLL